MIGTFVDSNEILTNNSGIQKLPDSEITDLIELATGKLIPIRIILDAIQVCQPASGYGLNFGYSF